MGYIKKMDQLSMKLEKNKDGYVLSSEELGKIMYFDDSDKGRKALIGEVSGLIMEIMNTEVEGGNKYL